MLSMGRKQFLQTVLRASDIGQRTRETLLAEVAAERGGEAVDVSLMRSAVRMLVELGVNGHVVYENEFERAFLRDSEAFYQEEAARYMAEVPVAAYLEYAQRRLAQEQRRLDDYLWHSTRPKLLKLVCSRLLFDHGLELVEADSGVRYMLQNDADQDLGRMYTLFSRVGDKRAWENPNGSRFTHFTLQEVLCETLKAHVVAEGSRLVTDQEQSKDPVAFVETLLTMRDKYSRIVRTAFQGHRFFFKALKEAFEHFVNMDTRCATFLSSYLDEMFKRGFKGWVEADIDKTLDKVITLFRYLVDKDIFLNIYRTHLSKRLLAGRSLSDDSERSMIAKLKIECGNQYAAKLEGMFQDLQQSKDLVDLYFAQGRPEGLVLLAPTVLTVGHWQRPQYPPCRLPSSVEPAAEHFQAFYGSRFGARRLTWVTEKGTAEVRMMAGSRPHDLVVTTYMMCILMQFNESAELTFGTILANTGIPRFEALRHVLSLTTSKARVLLKSKKGTNIAESDKFKVNDKFKHKMRRVVVPTIAAKGVGGAADAVGTGIPKAVLEDRKHMLDACIVRIMKTRQSLKHTDLIAEVTHALRSRFVPKPVDIKKRIENLIDREYLERDDEERGLYNYLA